MSSIQNSNANRQGLVYRASNVTLDLVTMGVFTARYNHGWSNAWTSDGRSYAETHPNVSRRPSYPARAAQRQEKQLPLEEEREDARLM
jgi:hypothetical protein